MVTSGTDETALTAWHEAGHVVGYLAHHRRFRYVTIRPRTPGTLGMIAVRPRRIDPMTHAVIAHMGPMAQGMYALSTYGPSELDAEGYEPGDVIAGAYLHGGCDDGHDIGRLVRAHGRIAGDIAEQTARTILTQRWDDVATVATALLDRRTLGFGDVVTLLRGTPGVREDAA